MGWGAFMLGSAMSNRGSSTETSVTGVDQTAERVEREQLVYMIGESNVRFLRKNEGSRFKFTNKLTNKPVAALYNNEEYFVTGNVGDLSSKSTTKSKGFLDW
jgi:hypothetical protein